MNLMSVGNFFVRPILKSPFHRMMSASTVLLCFRGWKSGRSYEVPVNYVKASEHILVSTQRNRSWWKNFRHHDDLNIWLEGKEVQAQVKLLEEKQDVYAALRTFFELKPEWVKLYRLETDAAGRITQTALDQMARENVVLEIRW